MLHHLVVGPVIAQDFANVADLQLRLVDDRIGSGKDSRDQAAAGLAAVALGGSIARRAGAPDHLPAVAGAAGLRQVRQKGKHQSISRNRANASLASTRHAFAQAMNSGTSTRRLAVSQL